MHALAESPGLAFDTVYIALPESLSVSVTVPAENELPSFDVVLEKAENVPKPAIAPTRPITSNVSNTRWLFFIPPFLLYRSGPGTSWPRCLCPDRDFGPRGWHRRCSDRA